MRGAFTGSFHDPAYLRGTFTVPDAPSASLQGYVSRPYHPRASLLFLLAAFRLVGVGQGLGLFGGSQVVGGFLRRDDAATEALLHGAAGVAGHVAALLRYALALGHGLRVRLP